jgi:hypothetical protein
MFNSLRSCLKFALAIVLNSCVFLCGIAALAQTAGNKGIIGANGVTFSSAYIDASAFYQPGGSTDLCQIINNILTSQYFTYPSGGAVVDARGIVPTTGSGNDVAQSCSVNPFPTDAPPSTVLLPASGINVASTWVLPSNTVVIGQGRNTILNSGFMSGDIVQMVGSSGVVVEHLRIEGFNYAGVNGIHNENAQDFSFVDDVNLHQIGGTGLQIDSGAANSGPYTNINFVGATSGTPVCVDIEASTRGLHGITCVGNATSLSGHAGIYVNAANNSIEDVHIESFYDGIEVGDTTNAVGNVTITNVTSAFSLSRVVNTVHLCGPNGSSTFGSCSNFSSPPLSDVALFGINDTNSSANRTTTSVADDVTGTFIGPALTYSSLVSEYILGESNAGGYSKFSTSQGTTGVGNKIPTWGVGASSLGDGTTSCTSNATGAIYSNTSGSGYTIYVCNGTVWKPIL